jgi:hypothetical protein
MTARSRVAITVAIALLLGASTYGHAFDIDPPGVLSYLWHEGEWITFGLAILGVFLVFRWWALLPAIAPVAVTVYLHSMTDYVPPWHEESYDTFSNPLFVLLVIGGILLQAAFLAVGLLLRAIWESVRSDSMEPAECRDP